MENGGRRMEDGGWRSYSRPFSSCSRQMTTTNRVLSGRHPCDFTPSHTHTGWDRWPGWESLGQMFHISTLAHKDSFCDEDEDEDDGRNCDDVIGVLE